MSTVRSDHDVRLVKSEEGLSEVDQMKQNVSSQQDTFLSRITSLAWIWFLVQGLSSICLTIFNKKLAQAYHYPVRTKFSTFTKHILGDHSCHSEFRFNFLFPLL